VGHERLTALASGRQLRRVMTSHGEIRRPVEASASAGLRRSGVGGARRRRTPVEDSVGDGGGDRADRALARTRRRQLGAVQQHDVDRLGRLGDAAAWVPALIEYPRYSL
jgi:hypothetical protein